MHVCTNVHAYMSGSTFCHIFCCFNYFQIISTVFVQQRIHFIYPFFKGHFIKFFKCQVLAKIRCKNYIIYEINYTRKRYRNCIKAVCI